MKVTKNNVVALSYELTVDGAVADKATAERPLEYIHGNGMLLPKFESEVEGKEPGEDFAFVLSPEEGYGVRDEKLKFDIPKSSFEVDGKLMTELLVPGKVVPLLNAYGQVVQATVVEVKDESVTLDFNHQMAGKTLHFTGRVETVREATAKEIKEGLHGEYLPKEEGGCCHGKGGCHKGGEGCCHGEGHEGGCHGEGHEGGCHGEGHEGGEGCCHGKGQCKKD